MSAAGAVDHLIGQMRKQQDPQMPPDCVGRFLCTKSSWRGKYRRIMCITPNAVITQHPDNLSITNTYIFTGEPDIDGVTVSASESEEQEFTLSARSDKKSKYKAVKFSCKQRAPLLTALYQCIALAAAEQRCPIATKILGSPQVFVAYKLRKGQWVPSKLRVTSYAVERLDPYGSVIWRLEYRNMASPAARLLVTGVNDPGSVFAFFGKVGRSPRVFAARDRDSLLRELQAAALKKMGLTVAVDRQARMSGPELLEAVGNAERERAAAPDEVPLGEWEAVRVRPDCNAPLISQALLTNAEEAKSLLLEGSEGRRRGVTRRLVLTGGALLERRPATYEVAERRQLAALAAVVRFAAEPTWLALEWTDGAPAAMYILPGRDALLAALLDAAQVSAGRPIPVLPQHTFPGNVVLSSRATSGLSPPVLPDAELEKLCLGHMASAAKDALNALGDVPSSAAEESRPSHADASDGSASDHMSVGSPPDARRRTLIAGMAASFGGRYRDAAEASRQGALRGTPQGAASYPEPVTEFRQRVAEFNACIPYSGVSSGARLDDPALTVLLSLLPLEPSAGANPPPPTTREAIRTINVLHCLLRLSTSAPTATAILQTPGAVVRIFAAMTCGHEHVAAEALRLLARLWAPAAARSGQGPWVLPRVGAAPAIDALDVHSQLSGFDMAAAARMAKSTCLGQSGRAAALVGVLRGSSTPTAAYATMSAVEALAAVVCPPGADSTDPILRHALLSEAGALGHPLFALFSHPARRVLDAAALIIRAVASGGDNAAAPMREAALTEGAMLHHLSVGMSGAGDPRAKLSRDLVALLADDYKPALDLLRRIYPPGLVQYLNQQPPRPPAPAPRQPTLQPERPPAQERQADVLPRERAMSPQPRNPGAGSSRQEVPKSPERGHLSPVSSPPRSPRSVIERQGLQRSASSSNAEAASALEPGLTRPPGSATDAGLVVSSSGLDRGGYRQSPPASMGRGLRGNWDAFWAAALRDHCHAGLIWNQQTRSELREALQAEESALRAGRTRVADGAGGWPTWNHAEFRVRYASLGNHLCVAGIYIKLLLDGLDQGAVDKVPAPKEVFGALHHHFLCLADMGLRLVGPQAAGAGAGEQALLAAAVSRDPEAERELCARAMAALYHSHGAAIGPFENTAHVAALLDRTMSRGLRHCLLRLLEALLIPRCAHSDEKASLAARANAIGFVEAGGVQLAVDLVAGAHEAKERTQVPLQTNLIEYSAHATEVKEWFYYAEDAEGEQRSKADRQEGSRMGPVSKDELKTLFYKGKIGLKTAVWVAGLAEPVPLWANRELRWLVSKGTGTMSPTEAAEIALRMLHSLAQLQPAVDAQGHNLQPLPAVHRILASPQCLPHIAQVLLTGEPALVSLAVMLLEVVLEHNGPALASLYQTGVFFFALAYCGSNLVEIGRLFKVAHLCQHFKGAAGFAAGTPLGTRSFLGGLLPESLLHMLTSYGAGAFAAALVGDSDTPELVWTHRMRAQRLVPQMHQHLGNFPRKLAQHAHAVYECVACPPVGFPELKEEMWCHRYYLRNLCDDRFSDWPIVDHIPLLQALLDEWRAELARKPLGMSEAEACALLEIQTGPEQALDEEVLKAAYRRLARKFHPDKNPTGRERFMAVQKAYERLQAGAAAGQGPQPWRLLLILKAQCILFRRYPDVLEPFKYGGYPMLLDAVTLPDDDTDEAGANHFLAPEKAPLLQAAVELCWLTCVSSELNGGELTRSGGVDSLGRLMQRCLDVLPRDAPPSLSAVIIAMHCMRTFAGMASFADAREQLQERKGLVADIVQSCGLERATGAVDAALQCVIQMAASPALQELMLKVGVLGYVVPLLFGFDATQGDSGAPSSDASAVAALAAAGSAEQDASRDTGPAFLGLGTERSNMQAARNYHAMLAVRALGRLAGLLQGKLASAPCQAARTALSALLTPALAAQLANPDPKPLLVHLNSSLLNPQVVWNSKMREEVLAQMEAARVNPEKAGTAQGFRFEALQGELVVANVFVRVYNEQPTFPVSDPAAFCKGLVSYLHMQAQSSWFKDSPATAPSAEGDSDETAEKITRERAHMSEAVQALRNILEAQPRLAAIMASRPALEPILDCIHPICRRLHQIEAEGEGGEHAAAAAAAKASPEAASEAAVAAQALAVLVRLTAQSGAQMPPPATFNEWIDEVSRINKAQRSTVNGGCVEALANERALLLAFWVVHRPPSATALALALRLLHALAATPAAAWSAAAQGGAVYLLTALLPTTPPSATELEASETVRAAIATLLGQLMAQPLHGPRITLLLSRLLPPGLVAAIQEGPGEAAVAALGQASETPERLWNMSMAMTTADELAALAASARRSQASGRLDWAAPEGFRIQFEGEQAELFIGGVYVRLFLKNSQFPLRHPKRFLEGLLEAYTADVQASKAERAVLLAAAAVELLRAHPLLADHAVALGAVDKLLRTLAANAPQGEDGGGGGRRPTAAHELGGSALRLLHQLARATTTAEALARTSTPAVPTLLAATRWGLAGSILALETLKLALSTDNRARDSLVGAALAASLLPKLLAKLDWRKDSASGNFGEEEERAESMERVLAVDILHLLAAEGVYGAQVAEQLNASDVWHAYRDQKHDLFLPAGGTAQGGVFGLLTGSNVARFALPAPEPPMEAAPMSAPAPPATVPPASAVAALSGSRAADDKPSGHFEDAEPQVQPTAAAVAAVSGRLAAEESPSGHFEDAEAQVPTTCVPSGVSEPSQGESSAAYSAREAVPSGQTGSTQSRPPPAPRSGVSVEEGNVCQQPPSGVPAAPHAGLPVPDNQLPPELGPAPGPTLLPSSHPAPPVRQGSTSGISPAEVAAPATSPPMSEGGAHVPAAAAVPVAAAASATNLAPVAAEPEGEPHIRAIAVAEAPAELEPEPAPPTPGASKDAPPDADDGHCERASMEDKCAPLPEPHAPNNSTQITEGIAGQPGASGGVDMGLRTDESSLGHRMSVNKRGLSANGNVSLSGEGLDSNGDAASELQPSSQAVFEAATAVPAASALPRTQPTAVAGAADTDGFAAPGVAKEQASAASLPKQELQAALSDSPPPAEREQFEKAAQPRVGQSDATLHADKEQSTEAAKSKAERLADALPQAPITQSTAASQKPAAAMPAASGVQPSAETADAKPSTSDAASEWQALAEAQPVRAVPETPLKSPTSARKPAPQAQSRQTHPGAAPQAASSAPSATQKSVAAASTVMPQPTDPLQSLLGQSQPASQPALAALSPRIVRSPVQGSPAATGPLPRAPSGRLQPLPPPRAPRLVQPAAPRPAVTSPQPGRQGAQGKDKKSPTGADGQLVRNKVEFNPLG